MSVATNPERPTDGESAEYIRGFNDGFGKGVDTAKDFGLKEAYDAGRLDGSKAWLDGGDDDDISPETAAIFAAQKAARARWSRPGATAADFLAGFEAFDYDCFEDAYVDTLVDAIKRFLKGLDDG